MQIRNYVDKIEYLLKNNPSLSPEQIGVFLTADVLYRTLPSDLQAFRESYAHFDPKVSQNGPEKLIFLKIAASREPANVIKGRLNSYLNIKFNDTAHFRSYEENMRTFSWYSAHVSGIIEDILGMAAFPKEITECIKEDARVRDCKDILGMLSLYRAAEEPRLRFEILRKLGLIVLLSRTRRSVFVQAVDTRMVDVWKAFRKRLGRDGKLCLNYYFWLDSHNKVRFCKEKHEAERLHLQDSESRRCIALRTFPLQRFVCRPFRTPGGHEIMKMEIRNKLNHAEKPYYTSFIEKMLRKNLEFPSSVRDIVGIKIVVGTEDEIPDVIDDIETFLGGSSTRKKEKNSYHKFGRRPLSVFSSPDYFVWKAIYDITLPHPSIQQVERLLALAKDSELQLELKKMQNNYIENPRDFLIEVQLQDIKSYLQSMASGSPTSHALLKRNQVRSNSFYKFFPKEIYEPVIRKLKQGILCGYSPALTQEQTSCITTTEQAD